MLINREGKLFGKVSIIDILVIIAVVILGLGFYVKFIAPSDTIVAQSQNIEYVMKVRDVRDTSVGAIEKGGPVYDSKTKEKMGEIVGVEYTGAVTQRALTDGSYVESEIPEKYDVYITVRTEGKANDTGYYTRQNKQLTAGSTFIINSKFAKTSAEIVEISTY